MRTGNCRRSAMPTAAGCCRSGAEILTTAVVSSASRTSCCSIRRPMSQAWRRPGCAADSGLRSRPSARVRGWTSTESTDVIDAEHDAYADLPDPVRHRRRILFVKPDFWVVVDDLTGGALHDIEMRFQLTTPPSLRANGAAWVG